MTRFSLKWLLAAVTLTAFGLTALLNASWAWTSAVVSLTLLFLLTASLAVLCQPSPRRAFWLGFAIFGWGFLVVLHTPLGETYRVRSPTTAVLDKAYEAISPEDLPWQPPEGAVHLAKPRWRGMNPVVWDGPSRNEFHRVGNHLWTWVLALAGGLLARWFHVAQEPR